MTPKPCPVCSSPEPYTIDKLLVLGKRGPRSLAPVFGIDRRDIARHEKRCLVGERRAKVEADLLRMAGRDPDEGGGHS